MLHRRLRVSRTAVIYGANASGKSNLLKALSVMRRLTLDSVNLSQRDAPLRYEPFSLDLANIDQPTYYEIVAVVSTKQIRYGFRQTDKEIHSEWLYESSSGPEKLVFNRVRNKVRTGKSHSQFNEMKVSPKELLISLASINKNPVALELTNWFREIGLILSEDLQDVKYFTLHCLEEKVHADRITKFLKALDLSISQIDVEFVNRDEVSIQVPDEVPSRVRDRLLKSIFTRESEVKTMHNQYSDGEIVGMKWFDLDKHESMGTQKLFALAGPICDSLANGTLLCIDEFDARLHPMLTQAIVRHFDRAETNPNGAQLMFTTHDVQFLDQRKYQRDQIWFVEKRPKGDSTLYSLAEFKISEDDPYVKLYSQGRLGAIPYIGDLSSLTDTAISDTNDDESKGVG